jgi:AraC-like DNA-binding protein
LHNLAGMAGRPLHFLFGQFVPRCTHRIDKVFADYCVLQYMHGGAVRLSVDGQERVLEGRHFFSSYPGPRIAFRAMVAGSTWVHRYLAFRGPALEGFLREGLFPVPPMPAPREPGGLDYAHRFDQLLELSRRDDAFGYKRALLELERLLCELAEARASPVHEPAWLAPARSRLESLGTRDIDYDELATELGFAPRTFRREFQKATGLPPHQYLLNSRISHARELLAHTDLPLKQIARELGYTDVFYFTRHFKRAVGVPPGMFRRSREG